MNRRGSRYAIKCDLEYGSFFCDIKIYDNCNKDKNSINDGYTYYECHPQYKSSLFVNTARSNNVNMFSVLDYEVYCIDNYKDYIYNICKYPDIIWEYCKTKDISEELLKQADDELELLNDLDAIHCDDSAILVKISCYYLKNPSELLPDTQIVDRQYDSYLKEWAGDIKWRLIYRASENGYTAESLHEYYDNGGPTLVVIKSSEGWIFGYYETQSWNERCIYIDMI